MPAGTPNSANRYRAAWRRRWSWALVCLLAGPLGGYAFMRMLPPVYVSSAEVGWNLPPQASPGTLRAAAEVSLPSVSEVAQRSFTAEHLASLAGKLGLYPPQQSWLTPADPAMHMRRDLSVTPSERGAVISFSAGSAHLAQRACSALVALLLEANPPPRTAPENAVQDLLAAQVQDAKHKLDKLEAQLEEFKRRHPGGVVDGDASPALALAALHAQLADVQAGLDKAAQDKALADAALRQQLAAWHSAQAPPAQNTQPLEQELADKQARLATLETRYTHDYPDVVKLRNDIAVLQKKLDDTRKSAAPPPPQNPDTVLPGEPAQVAATRAQLHQLDLAIQDKTRERQRLELEIQAAEARGQTSAALAEELESLTSARSAAQSAYDSVLARQKLAQDSAAEQARRIRTLEVTAAPGLPAAPSDRNYAPFVLGGAAGGLLLGLLVILAAAWSDTALRTEKDIERHLGLPTLALIPTTSAAPSGVQEAVKGAGSRADSGTREESVLAGH